MKANQLAETYFNENTLNQMERMSQTFIKSQACPRYIQNAPQLVMVLQTGFEMGMKPIEAMNSLYIVNGAINLWGKAVVRRLREHGWSIQYEMIAKNGGACKAIVIKGEESYTETYHFESAERSGYTKDSRGGLKVGWREGVNRNLKLRYGAVSMIIKTYIPEVLGAASEVQEVYEDAFVEEDKVEEGEVVNGGGKTRVMSGKTQSVDEFLKHKKAEKAKKAVKKQSKTAKKVEKPEEKKQ